MHAEPAGEKVDRYVQRGARKHLAQQQHGQQERGAREGEAREAIASQRPDDGGENGRQGGGVDAVQDEEVPVLQLARFRRARVASKEGLIDLEHGVGW
jgi:hypothetical protein